MKAQDPYQTLGVTRSASHDEIKRSYRKLAQKLHPDRNEGNATAEQRFKRVNSAYEVLGNKEKRELYDEFGAASLQSGFDARRARNAGAQFFGGGSPFGGPGQGNFQDLLSQMFSGGSPRPRAGADREITLSVDLIAAIKGIARTIRCAGETIEISVPAGVRDGQKIRLTGLGEPGHAGGPRGNLVVAINIPPHPSFERREDDVYSDLPVTVREAIMGAELVASTPDGPVEVRIPPGSQTGRQLRLRGLGAPARGGARGDFYLKVAIQVPRGEDPRLLELATELEAFYQGPVRDEP